MYHTCSNTTNTKANTLQFALPMEYKNRFIYLNGSGQFSLEWTLLGSGQFWGPQGFIDRGGAARAWWFGSADSRDGLVNERAHTRDYERTRQVTVH
jgi:hypothetical protein